MAEVVRYTEYTKLPCEIPPMERQSRVSDLSDIAMVLTVERCYPGAIDEALQQEEYDDIDIIRFIQDRYAQALTDFGFAQARGLELGLLVRSSDHCERKSQANEACDACLLKGLGQDFGDRLGQLKELALSRGLTKDEFYKIWRFAADAANDIPEVPEDNEGTERALELTGRVVNWNFYKNIV